MGDEQPRPYWLLRILPSAGLVREQALRLLLARCTSRANEPGWSTAGTVFVLQDPAEADGDPAAAALVVPVGVDGTAEVRLLGAAPRWEGADVELHLLEELADAMRGQEMRKMCAAAGRGEVDRIATLTRAGFRPSSTVPRAVNGTRGERGDQRGRQDRQQFWFELEL